MRQPNSLTDIDKRISMLISIIVPVHNESKRMLYDCINSILLSAKITNFQIEILICDDHSNDETKEAIKRIIFTDARIKYIESRGYGVSSARNEGLEAAKGDYIGFCDADDMFSSIALHEIEQILNDKNDVSLIVGSFKKFVSECEIKQTESISEEFKLLSYNRRELSAEKLAYRIIYDKTIMGSVWNKFFKCDLLKDIRFDINLSMCEDTEFITRVIIKYYKMNVIITNCVLYYYRTNLESATNTFEKVFHSNGRLKYYDALDKIYLMDSPFANLKSLIKGQKAYLALQPEYLIKTRALENYLKKEALKNLRGVFILILYDKKEMLRRILLIIIFILFGKRMNEIVNMVRSIRSIVKM